MTAKEITVVTVVGAGILSLVTFTVWSGTSSDAKKAASAAPDVDPNDVINTLKNTGELVSAVVMFTSASIKIINIHKSDED